MPQIEDKIAALDTDFKQQRLPSWDPITTPRSIMTTLTLTGLVFVIIGGVLLGVSNDVVEMSQRYDNQCAIDATCTFNMTVPTSIQSEKLYLYYRLTHYHQNHRAYVMSRSDSQLNGDVESSPDSCKPLQRSSGQVLYPCGLVAGSYFSDDITLSVDGNGVSVSTDGIAWETDKDKYEARALAAFETNIVSQDGNSVTLPAVTEERFMVWMRSAGLPTFRKLYGIIEMDLNAGDIITFTVENNYDTSGFKGEKHVVLSTTTPLGGNLDALALAFLIPGVLQFVFVLFFAVIVQRNPRELGDVEAFKFNTTG